MSVGVDADGGHTHTGGHNGNLNALVVAGVAVDTTDIVYKNRILQKILSNKLGTQGITRH